MSEPTAKVNARDSIMSDASSALGGIGGFMMGTELSDQGTPMLAQGSDFLRVSPWRYVVMRLIWRRAGRALSDSWERLVVVDVNGRDPLASRSHRGARAM